MNAASSVQAIASALKLGELFQYAVGNVTLARQKSAMLPIITDSIELERLSIYNASVLPTNPLNGVRLKNTTGKHLLQGPVTVLDKGGYAGDARIDNVPPGQERLLSYGIDLDVLVDNTKNTQTSAVQTAKISQGTLLHQAQTGRHAGVRRRQQVGSATRCWSSSIRSVRAGSWSTRRLRWRRRRRSTASRATLRRTR